MSEHKKGCVPKRALSTLCLMAAILFAASPASAQYFDGQRLYSECEKGSSKTTDSLAPFGLCIGYIVGVADQYELHRHILGKKEECIPMNVQQGTLRDVVMKFLRDNPGKRSQPAAALIMLALFDAYPGCAT